MAGIGRLGRGGRQRVTNNFFQLFVLVRLSLFCLHPLLSLPLHLSLSSLSALSVSLSRLYLSLSLSLSLATLSSSLSIIHSLTQPIIPSLPLSHSLHPSFPPFLPPSLPHLPPSLVPLFVRSVVRSFVRSFRLSSDRAFVSLFYRSSVCLFIRSVVRSSVRSLARGAYERAAVAAIVVLWALIVRSLFCDALCRLVLGISLKGARGFFRRA